MLVESDGGGVGCQDMKIDAHNILIIWRGQMGNQVLKQERCDPLLSEVFDNT